MGTWIEIESDKSPFLWACVVPYVGTWIEIVILLVQRDDVPLVVPYVGTWIEIKIYKKTALGFNVVPYVGTWIEIEEQEELT